MMKKAILQGSATVLLFFASWFALKHVDWMSLLKIGKTRENIEEALGKIFWETFRGENNEVTEIQVVNSVDSLVSKICLTNNIQKSRIKVHILKNNDINAFALPDGHMVINTGLISASGNQEELCGVICHELAHIELGHIMEKLVKETGLSVLVSMTTGGKGTEMVKELARMLSSTAYDRSIEKEADLKAVDFLKAAEIDPEAFANFIYRIKDKSKISAYLSWMNNHPDAEERVRYIIEHSPGEKFPGKKILSDNTWDKLKESL